MTPSAPTTISRRARTQPRRRMRRGYTMVEVSVVVVAVGVAAACAMLGLSTVITNAKKGVELQAVFNELQQVRAQHLSASASPTSCLFMKDVGGSLSVEERDDCATSAKASLHDFGKAVVALRGGTACVDNLARAVDCSNGSTLTTITFDIDVDGRTGADGTVLWGGNGRLSATFPVESNASADVQAHLQDVSSVNTPSPTAIGKFAGTTTNPRGLLE